MPHNYYLVKNIIRYLLAYLISCVNLLLCHVLFTLCFFLLFSILNFGLKNVIFVSYVDEQRRSSPYGSMGQLPHLPVEENTIPIEF